MELIFTSHQFTNSVPVQQIDIHVNTTAFDLLEAAAKRHPCYNFKYKKYDFGRLITAICCLENNNVKGYFWFLYINGQRSSVGVDLLIPKNGDTITFKYEEYEESKSSEDETTKLAPTTHQINPPTATGQSSLFFRFTFYLMMLLVAISCLFHNFVYA